MVSRRLIFVIAIVATLHSASGTVRGAGGADWLQWGGPNRNFMVETTNLASSWPAGGPKRLWTRSLGEGHSAILAEGGRVYTMFRPLGLLSAVRRSQEEVVTALDAATGKTVWEFKYPAPTDGLDFSQGAGPHSTPLIVGDRLYATSTRRELFALDKATGQRVWSHDFIKEYTAPAPGRGYTCSPLPYNGTVIVTVGGRGQAIAAFSRQTGALVWKAGDFEVSPASPILIDVDGQTQLVLFAGERVAGRDRGARAQRHPARRRGRVDAHRWARARALGTRRDAGRARLGARAGR